MDNASRATNHLVAFYDTAAKKQPKANGVELVPIDHSNDFVLPGPAVVNVIYVRHPVHERELIPFADYDEKLARDRYEEALRVFTKLGAARIVATSHNQTTKHGSAKFGLKNFTFNLGANKGAAWSLAADLEGKGSSPVDPRPLRFHDIAGLDAVCEGVLNNGWRKGSITVTQSTTLGVDGELAGELKKRGFTLGMSGGKSRVTEFKIEAAFTPEGAKDLDAVVAAAESGPGHSSLKDRLSRVLGN